MYVLDEIEHRQSGKVLIVESRKWMLAGNTG